MKMRDFKLVKLLSHRLRALLHLRKHSLINELLAIFNAAKERYEQDIKITRLVKHWANANNLRYTLVYKKVDNRRHILKYASLFAFLNQRGIGTVVHEKRALFWYKIAAEEGQDSFAQRKLGWCYRKGFGIEPDDFSAFIWYRKAAEAGSTAGQRDVAYCYRNGIGTEMDEYQAFLWYKKSAENGSSRAQTDLAFCFRNGLGVQVDRSKAFYWHKKSAESGYRIAQLHLGDCYRDGLGTIINEEGAFFWYRKAAMAGNSAAQVRLANCYFEGFGTAKDLVKACEWSQKSAKAGNPIGLLYLGDCYREGVGIAQNHQLAYKCYQKAAAKGDSTAKRRIYLCEVKGIGVKKKSFDNVNEFTDDDKSIALTATNTELYQASEIGNASLPNPDLLTIAKNIPAEDVPHGMSTVEESEKTISQPLRPIKKISQHRNSISFDHWDAKAVTELANVISGSQSKTDPSLLIPKNSVKVRSNNHTVSSSGKSLKTTTTVTISFQVEHSVS
ncbi:hypothetical protein G9A89_002640 [Geosiphon pyriformis]|nr:hypothetical protein G9A89_002640 [Geosiphon pyriformis]